MLDILAANSDLQSACPQALCPAVSDLLYLDAAECVILHSRKRYQVKPAMMQWQPDQKQARHPERPLLTYDLCNSQRDL